MGVSPGPLDVRAIRNHFTFPGLGRIVTNNAASTQPPGELLALYRSLGPGYENVHRGQSSASQAMTARFEESYDTIARFIGAPGRASIAVYRNTTEAINAVMYSLLTECRHRRRPPRARGTLVSVPAPRACPAARALAGPNGIGMTLLDAAAERQQPRRALSEADTAVNAVTTASPGDTHPEVQPCQARGVG
jgi:hypothetical protein